MRRVVLLISALVLALAPAAAWGEDFSPLAGSATPTAPAYAITDLGGLPAYYGDSEATAINEAGQMVGWSGDGFLDPHAVLWDAGQIIELGVLPGDKWSKAHAINAAGQVVGGSGTASGPRHAVLWEGGQVTDLGVLPGGESSEAQAINEAGQVVGWSGGHSSEARHAVLWEGGQVTDLGVLWSAGRGMNGPTVNLIATPCSGSPPRPRSLARGYPV